MVWLRRRKLLNSERSQQNSANENKHGAHSQNIQSSQSKVHGSASLVELTVFITGGEAE